MNENFCCCMGDYCFVSVVWNFLFVEMILELHGLIKTCIYKLIKEDSNPKIITCLHNYATVLFSSLFSRFTWNYLNCCTGVECLSF